MTSKTKPPVWFSIVAVLALIWNALGVVAYLSNAFMSDEAKAALSMDQQTYLENLPAWYTAAFAIAVFGGALASLAMVFRKAAAYALFMISFVGILVQMIYNFFIGEALEVYGPGGMIMPVMVLLIGAALIRITKTGKMNGWIS